MDDEMMMADEPMAENEVCVDLASLSMPDENDQMNEPEQGDKVTLNIEGTVSRIVGEKAYVRQDAVNGKEVGKEPTPPDESAELEGMAANMPANY